MDDSLLDDGLPSKFALSIQCSNVLHLFALSARLSFNKPRIITQRINKHEGNLVPFGFRFAAFECVDQVLSWVKAPATFSADRLSLVNSHGLT